MTEAHHWIITNREVSRKRIGGKYVEVVTDGRREPLPVFRVAKFTPGGAGKKPTPESLCDAVEVVPDQFVTGYDKVDSTDDPTDYNGTAQMFLDLYKRMEQAPASKGDTLLFIHGFNYSWPDALVNLQRLHELYVVPKESTIANLVMFSWPSYGSVTRYPSDQAIAQPSGYLLGRVFAKARRFLTDFFKKTNPPALCGQKIHLLAHSMGNQVLEEFMRAVRETDFLQSPMFGEVLLLNADADWTALNCGMPLASLPDLSDRIHVYNNFSDDALLISEVTKNDRKRLGRHGPRDIEKIPPRSIVVDTTDVRSNVPRRPGDDVFYDAARRVLGEGTVATRERIIDHWGYLHRPEVIADVMRVLGGESASTIPKRTLRGPRLYRLT